MISRNHIATGILLAALGLGAQACANTVQGAKQDTERAAENTAAAVETVDVKAALIADGRVDASSINVDTFASTKTVGTQRVCADRRAEGDSGGDCARAGERLHDHQSVDRGRKEIGCQCQAGHHATTAAVPGNSLHVTWNHGSRYKGGRAPSAFPCAGKGVQPTPGTPLLCALGRAVRVSRPVVASVAVSRCTWLVRLVANGSSRNRSLRIPDVIEVSLFGLPAPDSWASTDVEAALKCIAQTYAVG